MNDMGKTEPQEIAKDRESWSGRNEGLSSFEVKDRGGEEKDYRVSCYI